MENNLKTDRFRIKQEGHIFTVQRGYYWSDIDLVLKSPSLCWHYCTETCDGNGFVSSRYEMTKEFFSIESAKGYIKKILELESGKSKEETILYHQYP